MINQIEKSKDKKDKNLDNWLASSLQRTIQKTTDAFEKFDLRVATNEIFFECQKNLQWYIKRGGKNTDLLNEFIQTWIKLMSPITPHLSEEIWHKTNKSFIADESYPKFDSNKIFEKEEAGEYLISKVTDDISEILKVTKIKPKKIYIYTSPSWKNEIFRKIIKISESEKPNVGQIIKDAMLDPKMKENAKEVSQYISKLPSEVMKLNDTDKKRFKIKINEQDYLDNSNEYLKKIFSCDIQIFDAEKKEIYDPLNKKRFAAPLKPAIYVE
jgi:leucyl-tRNA synthetase